MDTKNYIKEVDKAYAAEAPEKTGELLFGLCEKAEKENGRDSLEYGIMLNELASYERGQYKLRQAEEHFIEAHRIISAIEGETSFNCATIINNLAGVYRMAGEFDKAEEYFLKCLNLYERTVGKEHMLYAAGLNNLSVLFVKKGDNEKAERFLNESAEILKKHPEARGEFATSLINLGALQLNLEKYDEACESLLKAKAVYDAEENEYNQHYHMLLNNLGIALIKLGKTQEALARFEEAEKWAEKTFGKEHVETKSIRKTIEKLNKTSHH